MTLEPRWEFRRKHRADIYTDPVHEEFFTTEALRNLSEGLVREFIQNALDARANSEPVRLHFLLLREDNSLRTEWVHSYLLKLERHLQAQPQDSLVLRDPLGEQSVACLVLEDFGTRGLQGDPKAGPDPGTGSGSPRNDFFYFWRNIGRSAKSEADRGRWGLGHGVFAAASRIRAFYGLTVRANDGKKLLMGQAILKTHSLGDGIYQPYGYFARFEDDGFAIPIEDEDYLARFSKSFRLTRGLEPGLSVVIPFVREEIKAPELARAVLEHFFYALLAGDLTVEIRSPSAGQSYHLSAHLDSLKDVAKSLYATPAQADQLHEIEDTLNLAQWSIQQRDRTTIQTEPPGEPDWDHAKLPDTPGLRARYQAGERLALQVPLRLRPKGAPPAETSFQIFMESVHQKPKGHVYFIRQGMLVPNQNAKRVSGVRALVVADEGAVCRFLGDSENPAHTEWQERSEKFSCKYDRGPKSLRFIKNAVPKVAEFLAPQSEEVYKDLLKHFFSLPAPRFDETAPGEGGPDPGYISPPPAIGPQSPLGILVHKIEGGFSVKVKQDSHGLPRDIFIKAAYAVRRGDPFRRYSPLDFDFNNPNIQIEVEPRNAAAYSVLAPNRLQVLGSTAEYTITVTGFDPQRDLCVHVSEQ